MTGTKVKFGIVVFPGSNCDYDAYYVCKKILDQDAEFLWHKEPDLKVLMLWSYPEGFPMVIIFDAVPLRVFLR